MSHQDIIDALCYAQKKYWKYTNLDVGSTNLRQESQSNFCLLGTRLRDTINLEKEINDMDERRLMNGMKKGMTVVVVEHPNLQGCRGTIEAFDYNNLRVGVRFSTREKLTWFAPSNLHIEYQIRYWW